MNKIEKAGALASVSIGLPTGLAAVALAFLFPAALTGEGLFTVGYILINGYATVGLLLAFIVMLWLAGKTMGRDIRSNKGTFKTTVKYSVTVNLVIWAAFILVHVLTNQELDLLFGLFLPVVLGIVSMILTPFTIGLWIFKVAKGRIEKIADA